MYMYSMSYAKGEGLLIYIMVTFIFDISAL